MNLYNENLVETLHTPPSWVNRAGRPDRSALLVLRTRDVKHLFPRMTLWPIDLQGLYRTQLPLQTSGDHRTTKSNAIKCRFRRGLFLPPRWSQTLRIERHQLHAKLTQHFLVCPGCGSPTRRPTPSRRRDRLASTPSLPGRCLKLYLPFCTAAEWRDADLVRMVLAHAAPWSLGLPTKSLHPVMPPEIVSELIHRYQPLLFRGLLCRHCLGLRYGEVKLPGAAAKHPLAPDWAKDKPDYYQSLTVDQRAKVSEMFNLFRRDREYRQQQQQKIDRLERQIDALERKYPGTKFRA